MKTRQRIAAGLLTLLATVGCTGKTTNIGTLDNPTLKDAVWFMEAPQPHRRFEDHFGRTFIDLPEEDGRYPRGRYGSLDFVITKEAREGTKEGIITKDTKGFKEYERIFRSLKNEAYINGLEIANMLYQ